GLLDLSVLPVEPRQAISLQDALAELGSSVRQGFVLFGLEEKLSEGKEPMVDLRINANTTLGTVLREILSQLPAYEMEVVSDHLIDLRPKGGRDDPDNVLNLRV